MPLDFEELLIDIIEEEKPTDDIDRSTLLEIIHMIHAKYLKAKIILEMEVAPLKELNKWLTEEHENSLSLLFQIQTQNLKNEYYNKELKKLNRKLDRINKTDHLTKLLNRRTWLEYAEIEVSRANRNIESLKKSGMYEKVKNIGSLTVAFLDVDNFKKINDNYGHHIGDKVLKEIGKLLLSKSLFRKTDIAGRYGGEEFIILFPDLSASNSGVAVNKFLDRIRNLSIPDGKGSHIKITLSAGVSDFNLNDSLMDIIKRADQKMYAAKAAGKDRLMI